MYDLIIIGGGMSGISVAHFFREKKILLLEKEQLLSGATGNNAGFLISGFGEHFHRTASRWGMERAMQIQNIHLSSHRKIMELTGAVRQIGSYTIAVTSKEMEDVRKSFELMRAEGLHVRWLDHAPAGLRKQCPGILNLHDGLIDSAQFWKDLAKAIPYKTNCDVKEVRDDGNQLVVRTSREAFCASSVVYCLNAYSSKLLPELEGRFIPLQGQMAEFKLLAAPPCKQPVIAEYGEVYWNFTDQTLRFGGLEYLVPEQEIGIALNSSEKILQKQKEWIHKHMDLSFLEEPLRTWYGTMAFTVDGFPFVGELPCRRNQYVLAGMCGLGHSYAMECASWLSFLILEGRNVIPEYFSSDRILSLPKYEGGSWRSLYEAWNH